jgi:hypothetical protein
MASGGKRLTKNAWPTTSAARPTRTGSFCPRSVNSFSTSGWTHHDTSSSPLLGMSEVPHAIPDCFQPLLQRVLRYTHGSILVGGIDSVLRLRETRRLESMEVERIEDLQGFESGSPARLRHVGRNCARTPSPAESAACVSPARLTLKPQVGSAPASVLSNPDFAALKRWPRGGRVAAKAKRSSLLRETAHLHRMVCCGVSRTR